MEALNTAAEWFVGLFRTSGDVFLGIAGAILPMLIVFLTVIYAINRAIGEDRVNRIIQSLTRWSVLRYTLAPLVSSIFFMVPLTYATGMFMKEENKAAYYDANSSQHHPLLGLFPYIHPPEYFVYFGVAKGVQDLGLDLGALNVRLLIAALIVSLMRGLITDRLYAFMAARKVSQASEIQM